MNTLSFFSRDNITLALAIFGSLGTICTWLYYFITTRLSITVEILTAYRTGPRVSCYVFFQNNSRLPVSISSVFIAIDKAIFSSYPIQHTPYAVQEKWGKETPKGPKYLTLSMPINLSSLGGTSGFLDFYIPEEHLNKISNCLDLHISTNRGNVPGTKLKFNGFYSPFSPNDLV